jgi:MoxR-like ATPase
MTAISPIRTLPSPGSAADTWRAAMDQVASIVRGKSQQIQWMFAAFLSGGHVLLEDTPGMGKTTLARAMAMTLGLDARRIQFTSDLMPADVVGLGLPSTHDGQTRLVFHPGPMFANILLADEINRASPRTQSALLEAMAEGAATVDGVRHGLPNPFWVIATQNPVDLSGTFPLPDSQMDRFALRLSLGYPQASEEVALLLSGGTQDMRHLEPVLTPEGVLAARQAVEEIRISEAVAVYVQKLGQATREHPEIAAGLSPRALLSLLATARGLAWLAGREYVVPQDIQSIFLVAAAHRLVVPGADWDRRAELAALLSKDI